MSLSLHGHHIQGKDMKMGKLSPPSYESFNPRYLMAFPKATFNRIVRPNLPSVVLIIRATSIAYILRLKLKNTKIQPAATRTNVLTLPRELRQQILLQSCRLDIQTLLNLPQETVKKSDLHKTIRDWAANLNSSVDGTVAGPDVEYAVERCTDWVDSETADHDLYLYSRNNLRAKFEVANVKKRFHHRFAGWNWVRARRIVRKGGWVVYGSSL